MFAHSATFTLLIFLKIQWFFLDRISLSYIILSLTKLQNYSLCESPINSFEVSKNEKTTATKIEK